MFAPSLALARDVQLLLHLTQRRIVCAESCTAGLIAATLAAIPGASAHLCGSAVVYRNDTKTRWLHVPEEVLSDEARGDVCSETAERMAAGVLANTPEAHVALSITGHLGPGSPEGMDGLVFVGWAEYSGAEVVTRWRRIELPGPVPLTSQTLSEQVAHRTARQQAAVIQALQFALEQLAQRPPTSVTPSFSAAS